MAQPSYESPFPPGPPPLRRDAPPPVGPTVPDAASRSMKTFGTVALVLAIAHALYCVLKVLSGLMVGPVTTLIVETLSMSTKGVPPPPELKQAFVSVQKFATKIAIWDAARMVPFLAAAILLIVIAVRLQRGDHRALEAARTWTWWAFGAIGASVLIQAIVTVPATLEYMRNIADALPKVPHRHGGPPPPDLRRMLDGIAIMSSTMSLVTGAGFMAVWPIVVRIWAGKLQRGA